MMNIVIIDRSDERKSYKLLVCTRNSKFQVSDRSLSGLRVTICAWMNVLASCFFIFRLQLAQPSVAIVGSVASRGRKCACVCVCV